MSIPTLAIVLTLLVIVYGFLWHDETADDIRNTEPHHRGSS